jgi:ribosomal protein S27E
MLLPSEILLTPIADPIPTSTDFPSVNVSCPECKHVDNYQVQKGGPTPPDSGDRLVWLRHIDYFGFLEFLECEVEDCEPQTTVFAPRTRTMTAEEKQADRATWTWGRLLCPNAHPIPKPEKKQAS